ncbi:MAG: DUF86 domain-containing protein [Sphingobacteriales bacterium]
MSEREVALLLQDMLESIQYINDFTKGLSYEEYENDLKTRYAAERSFEIIGEAAARVPEDFKKKYQQIKWREVKDFRNILAHEYFGLDNSVIWNIIHFDLPELENEIKSLLKILNYE